MRVEEMKIKIGYITNTFFVLFCLTWGLNRGLTFSMPAHYYLFIFNTHTERNRKTNDLYERVSHIHIKEK